MAGPWNLQGPAVDFSPLGQLYAGFIGAQDHARKRQQEDEAGPLFEKMLAAAGQQQGAAQPGSLSALAAQTGGMPGLPGNGAGAAMTPKGPPGEREKQAFDFFVSQGHSPAAAAGIVGNLVQESGLNPGAINRGDGSDGSHSIGIGQWNAGRAKALQQFAAQRGTSVGDLNTQLAFVQHELSGPESRVGQQLRGVNDPQAAAGIFAGYERPRGWREGGDPSQIHGWQNRSGTAARLMAAYGGNVPSNVAPGGNVQVASLGPVGVPPQAAMPTQNPNGGDPTSNFNTPIGQNVYGGGFNAPTDTRVPLGPQGGAPSAPATMQAQAQVPDPRADMPSQNAAEAQFYVPGSGAAPAAPRQPAAPAVAPAPTPAAPAMAPAAALGAGGMTPEFRAALGAALRNPETRQAALALWQNAVKPGEYGFQKLDDGTIVRTNPRTGAVEPVYQATAKPDLDVKEVNGRLIAFDKRTQTSRDVTPEGMPPGARPMTPDEKVKYNISADTGAFFDAKGVPHTLGPTTQVNIDQKAESKFESTMAEGSAKRWNGYIENSDKAQGSLGDINTLRELSGRLGSQGSSAAVKETLGPYAESLGINIEGLSDIQAYQSVIQKLAPQLHVAGSGATSDIEFKGMLKALPSLSAHPDARNAIMDTMEAQARYAIEKGDIARDLADKTITRPEAEKRVRALADPMTAFKEWRKANPGIYGSALKGDGSTTQPGNTQPKPGKLPQGYTPESVRSEAAAAIKAGKDRVVIIDRLKSMGVDTSGL